MKSPLFFITYATANLSLVAYGAFAILMPSILLDPFTRHVYQFPVEAARAVDYLAALFRLLGFFNLVLGILNLLLLWRFTVGPQTWLLRMVIASSLLSYVGPIVFDNTVGSIGFFEILEHILFVAMLVSGLIVLGSRQPTQPKPAAAR